MQPRAGSYRETVMSFGAGVFSAACKSSRALTTVWKKSYR